MLRKQLTRPVIFSAVALALPAFLLTFPADAQNDRARSEPVTTGSPPSSSAGPRAPVGHRQPTAADVAGAADASDRQRDIEAQKREQALDRRLQFCRGC